MAARGVLLRLRRLAQGETGPGSALALAGVALLTVFVAMAGPRELASAKQSALRTALASLPGPDRLVIASAQWMVTRGVQGALPPAQLSQLSGAIGAALPRTADSPLPQRWVSAATLGLAVVNPSPGAVLAAPPTMEIVYRSQLGAHARLLSGTLPDAVQATRSGQGPAEVFQVAMSPATASRFGLRLGSEVNLGSRVGGSPDVLLRLSGLISPVQPGAGFWQADPVLPAPLVPNPPPCLDCGPPRWAGAALIGPAELVPLQLALPGVVFQGQWVYPLNVSRVTPAQLPRLISGLSAMATSGGRLAASADALFSPSVVNVSSGIATGLSAYAAQQQAASAVDALLIADVFLADLILMCICAQLAVLAHRPELILIRARGGSTAQLAARMMARAGCVTGPAIVAAAALAIAAVPASSAASWLLAGAAAVAALATPAVIAAWTHRRARAEQAGRPDLATPRQSKGLLVAELTVLAVAAAALIELRLQGIEQGAGLFSAAPVLVAAAAGLIMARLYPIPVRGLLRIASARPGPVGFLGLASAARSGLGAILPALALVISLTLAAFATMVLSSISSGQAAAAWRQAGADVMIQTAGNGTVSRAALRAVGSVRGVRRTTAVYTALANGTFAGELTTAGGSSQSVGLVMVDPGPYAALTRQTPWPDFPAGLLSRRAGGAAAVPVLVSAGLASRSAQVASGRHGPGAGSGTVTLAVDGIRLPVRVAATIGATPAMPGGGTFVVFPSWAAASYPSIAGPNTLLATGSGFSLRAVRAAAAGAMPVASVTSRAQVLSALVSAPAQRVAERLYLLGAWVAVALSLLATLFGLTESGRRRLHLAGRLNALGMPGRQSRALALTDLLPLLLVAVIGSLAAGIVLAVTIGPVLNLAVFAGSAGQVPVRPVPGMLLPAAGIVAAAIVIVVVQSAALLRRDVAAALRREEAG